MDSQDHKDMSPKGEGLGKDGLGLSREEMRAFLAGVGMPSKADGAADDPFAQEAMEGFQEAGMSAEAFDSAMSQLDANIDQAAGAIPVETTPAAQPEGTSIIRRLIPHGTSQWAAAAAIIAVFLASVWVFNEVGDNSQVAFEKNFTPITADETQPESEPEKAQDPILEWADEADEDEFTPLSNVTITTETPGPPEDALTDREREFYGIEKAIEETPETFDVPEEPVLTDARNDADSYADEAEELAADDLIPATGYAGDIVVEDGVYSTEKDEELLAKSRDVAEADIAEVEVDDEELNLDQELISAVEISDSQIIALDQVDNVQLNAAPTATYDLSSTSGNAVNDFDATFYANQNTFSNVEGPSATLNGRIYDSETGDPLIGAMVVVNGTTYGSVTDFDGNFQLQVPAGFQEVSIQYIGYDEQVQNFTFNDGEVQNRSFALNTAAMALEEVAISAEKVEHHNYGQPSADAMGFSETKRAQTESRSKTAKTPEVTLTDREMALAFYQEEKFRKAAKYFDRHLKEQPWDEEALLLSANAYLVLDNAAEAIKKLDQLVTKPSSPYIEEGQWYRALALLKLDRTQEAKTLLRQIESEGGTYAEKARATLKDL